MSQPRVLIVQGGWSGHEPGACAELVARELRAEGLEVRIEDDLAALDEDLTRYALIVPAWTMGTLGAERETALVRAVEGGVGLGGWHGGIADGFRDSLPFKFLVGGQFVAHPGGWRRYRVEVASDHPVVRGLEGFAFESEQYYVHLDPSVTVLATTTFDGSVLPWLAGVVMPVAWLRTWGRGRVFASTLGHGAADLAAPGALALLRRGLLWAAGASA